MIGKSIANGAVKVYKNYVSKDYNQARGSHCLYEPSCSAYMQDSIKRDGLLDGMLQGAMRLRRCKSDVSAYYCNEFAQALVKCPADSIDQRFSFDTPEDRSRMVKLKSVLDQSRSLFEGGDKEGSARLQKEWTRILKDDILFRVQDKPGQNHNKPSEFLVYHDDARKIAPQSTGGSKKTSGWRSAIAAAAGAVGGVLGAAIAGLGFALINTGYAAVTGLAAGTGKTDALNQHIAKKFGPATVYGMARFEKKTGKVGYEVYSKINQWTGSTTLASIAGVSVGLPVALAVGFSLGVKSGACSGYLGGQILAKNLVNCTAAASCTCGCHSSTGVPSL